MFRTMSAHTDYVTDIALIECSIGGTGGEDMLDDRDDAEYRDGNSAASPSAAAVHSPSTEFSILSGSTDKTIRLTPFSLLDKQFI